LSVTKDVTVLNCIDPPIHNLIASASGFCEEGPGSEGVYFSLSGTEKGLRYILLRDGTPVGSRIIGTGSAATFTDGPYTVAGTYTAQSMANTPYCTMEMNGTHPIAKNSPQAPTITAPEVCHNVEDLVFTITDYSGTPTWLYTGNGVVNGLTVTFSGATTGTQSVTAQTSQTYTNAPTCYSATVTKSSVVNRLPDNPTVTPATRCEAGTITLSATSPGAVIDWYDVAAGGTVLANGTATNSFTPTVSTSTTYYPQARIETADCKSVARTPVLATVHTAPTAPTELSTDIPTICDGEATNMTLTAKGGAPGSGAVYEWGTGTVGSGSIQSTPGNTYSVSPSAATTYWVRMKGTSACTAPTAGITTSIGVYPAITPGTITEGSTTTKACVNPDVTVLNSTPASGGSGSVTYQWRLTGMNSTILTGADASYPLNSDASSNYDKEGTYYINRYAKNTMCNAASAWVASSGTYMLYVTGPSGTVTFTKCTKCCHNGSTWVDCYVSPLMNGKKTWIGGGSDYVDGARSDRNGKANTAAIIAAVGAAGDGAVQSCHNLGCGWFLPAYEELINMSYATNTPLNGLPGAKLLSEPGDSHWSSTELYNNGGRVSGSSQSAAVMVYMFGATQTSSKADAHPVRCAWRN
jgi:hypothetical protein